MIPVTIFLFVLSYMGINSLSLSYFILSSQNRGLLFFLYGSGVGKSLYLFTGGSFLSKTVNETGRNRERRWGMASEISERER